MPAGFVDVVGVVLSSHGSAVVPSPHFGHWWVVLGAATTVLGGEVRLYNRTLEVDHGPLNFTSHLLQRLPWQRRDLLGRIRFEFQDRDRLLASAPGFRALKHLQTLAGFEGRTARKAGSTVTFFANSRADVVPVSRGFRPFQQCLAGWDPACEKSHRALPADPAILGCDRDQGGRAGNRTAACLVFLCSLAAFRSSLPFPKRATGTDRRRYISRGVGGRQPPSSENPSTTTRFVAALSTSSGKTGWESGRSSPGRQDTVGALGRLASRR